MKKIYLFLGITFLSCTGQAQIWDTLHTGVSANFYSVAFGPGMPNGIIAGKDPSTLLGEMMYTADRGNSWTPVSLPANTRGFNAAVYSSGTLAFAVTDSGYVFTSSDFGNSWSALSRPTQKNLYAIFFTNSFTGFTSGENGVLFRTTDGGISWDTLQSGSSLAIRAIHFSSNANGWITGDGGYLAMTSDSGNTWTQISNEPYFGFFNGRGIAMAGTKAYAVGDYGLAIKTSAPDTMWNALYFTTSNNLNCIVFNDSIGGLICGDNATIMRTHDGGLSWTPDTVAGVTQNLHSIAFTDSFAFICGDNGRLIRSHIDLTPVAEITATAFYATAFPNPFDDQLTIALDLKKNSSVQYSIVDITGRIIVDENDGELAAGKHLLHPSEVSALSNGMYFIHIVAGEQSITIPVIKQN